MTNRLSFLLSVLFHLILLFPFLYENEENPHGHGNVYNKVIEFELFDKQEIQNDEKDFVVRKNEIKKPNYCDNFYYGIGISVVVMEKEGRMVKEVVEVYRNYPAHRAGIKRGDIILNSNNPLRGNGVEKLELVINRNEELFTLTLFRDKICIDN
ncbi:MAG: hypothetical protein ABIM30_01310 [candidate division WOR-3 bacterium]